MEDLHVKGEAKIKNALKESFKILNEVCVSALQDQITFLMFNKSTYTSSTLENNVRTTVMFAQEHMVYQCKDKTRLDMD